MKVDHLIISHSALNVNTGQGISAVSVLDARNRTLLHTVSLNFSPDDLAVDPQTGRVFVFSQDNGTFSVLDARSGVILASKLFGKPLWPAHSKLSDQWPSSVNATVDAATGLLFVVHHYGGVLSVLDGHTGRVLENIVAR